MLRPFLAVVVKQLSRGSHTKSMAYLVSLKKVFEISATIGLTAILKFRMIQKYKNKMLRTIQ